MSPMKIVGFLYHLPSLLRLSVRLLRDSRVPTRLKVYCALAIGYFLLPFDFIPDMLLPLFGVGVADDMTFILLAFHKLIKDSPAHVVDEHVRAIGRTARRPAEDTGV
jgi:uncharacterized membrane protein YkvA (DUF1232 family)